MNYPNFCNRLCLCDFIPDRVLHLGWQPLFATLGDELLVDNDAGAEDLGLGVIETERGIQKWVVLEGLPVDVEDELAQFIIEVDSGLDAANIIRKGDWENRSNVAEGNASAILVGLVQSDVEGLVLAEVLGD